MAVAGQALVSEDLASDIVELKPRLLAFARSLSGEAEAEDLVQETYLRALGSRDRFTPGTNLKAWLFTILRNLYLNQRREIAARPILVALDGAAGEITGPNGPPSHVEHEVLFRADMADIVTAFRRLPTIFAVPLHLVAVEELSYAQVAALLELPIGTVMSRIYRGRRVLMDLLAEDSR